MVGIKTSGLYCRLILSVYTVVPKKNKNQKWITDHFFLVPANFSQFFGDRRKENDRMRPKTKNIIHWFMTKKKKPRSRSALEERERERSSTKATTDQEFRLFPSVPVCSSEYKYFILPASDRRPCAKRVCICRRLPLGLDTLNREVIQKYFIKGQHVK